MSKMPIKPAWLSVRATGRPVGVDRQGDGAIMGYVVAQLGPFKSEGRGEFDAQSLETIARLGNAAPAGLKVRFQHPNATSDGLGKYLGRAMDFSVTTTRNAAGVEVPAVRADLYFNSTAHDTPSGNLAKYVMDLAESDPDAISSSLVLTTEQETRLDAKGKPMLDENGDPLPPLWRPRSLHASDIVDTGDAVDGLLSPIKTSALPLGELWEGAAMLNQLFAGQTREVVEARCKAFLSRYLDDRYGPPQKKTSVIDNMLRLLELKMKQ